MSVIDAKELRKFGEKTVLDLLKLKGKYSKELPKVIEVLYMSRMPLSVREIAGRTSIPDSKLRYLLERLQSLEIVESFEDEGSRRYMITQIGIDFAEFLDSILFEDDVSMALSAKSSVEVLRNLNGLSWSELRRKLRISESSLFVVLDLLSSANLIEKKEDGRYYVSERGREVLKAFNTLSNLKVRPKYEVQLKLKADDDVLNLLAQRFEQVSYLHQKDFYILKEGRKGYLRYRVERVLTGSGRVAKVKHVLTWTEKSKQIAMGNVKILSRKREELYVKYPTILFFLEYLDAKFNKVVEKSRRVFVFEDLKIHYDEVVGLGEFVEIKSEAWDEKEAYEKCKRILKVAEELGISNRVVDKLYSEF